MFSIILVAAALGGVFLLVCVVAIALFVMRGRGGGGGRAFAEPRMSPTQSWQMAGAALTELGLHPLDAECFTRNLDGNGRIFVKAEIRDGTLLAWLESTRQGGSLEQFLGAKAELGPGDAGRSPLARFAADAVREPFGTLPRKARLSVKAPKIPGDEYKLQVTSPLHSPQHPANVARTLLALDEAARKPIPAGAHVQTNLPPAAAHWMAAAPALQALGLRQVDAELYTRQATDGIGTLYLNVTVRDGTIRGWIERSCPGGGLEQFLGQRAEVKPGSHGSGQLAQLVAATVGDMLAGLPRHAVLKVRAPEIPGADYELVVESPIGAPEHPAVAARVLLALDEAVRRPVAASAHAQASLPPAAAHWMAAAPGFAALGLHTIDAESYTRQLDGGIGSIYVRLDLPSASVRGWIERAFPGGVLDGFLRAHAEMHPGDAPRNELAQGVLGAIAAPFAALPRRALLTVKAPEIPGAEYSLTLTSPITSPDDGPAVARVLLALDAAVRVVH